MLKISIPYRGMEKCKRRMIDVLQEYETHSDIEIQIVEQSDDGKRFNLGKMINVGFDLFDKRSTENIPWVYMFHPIDLFPKMGIEPYISAASEILNNEIQILTLNVMGQTHFYRCCCYRPSTYKKFNGYTNNFWGWGAEDDEFFIRLGFCGIRVAYKNLEFNTWCETKQDHEPDHPSPDFLLGLDHHAKNLDIARSLTPEKMKQDGISNLEYKVLYEGTISKNIKHVKVEL